MLQPDHIRHLVHEIAEDAEQIAQLLESNAVTEPIVNGSFPEAPQTPKYEALRRSLSQSASDLSLLVNGPRVFVRSFCCSHYDLTAFQVALEFGMFEAIPSEGTVSLKELAKAIGLDEERTGSVLRLLATKRMFEEVEYGLFQHTAASTCIAGDEDVKATVLMQYAFLSLYYPALLYPRLTLGMAESHT